MKVTESGNFNRKVTINRDFNSRDFKRKVTKSRYFNRKVKILLEVKRKVSKT